MFVSHLACPRCSAQHDPLEVHNTCDCGSPLLVEYDMNAVGGLADADDLMSRPPTMWRYREFLPLPEDAEPISLDEGFTPLVDAAALGEQIGLPGLLIKDESPNPTATFKARGASCGISMAAWLDIESVALPTAGNAGGAWAAYGAVARIRVHVAMPRDAPAMNQAECLLYGAHVRLVDGTIADAAALIARELDHGTFDVSTLREPYRIEGKKTLGLEIAEQLGWQMPDAIVYPCGGGVGLIGIWRALQQLREIGWVQGELPRLIAVQAEGCAPIVRAWQMGYEESVAWEGAHTIATGLAVPKALGDFLVLQAIRETKGAAVAVSDPEILEAMRTMPREAGIAAAPEGAATLAGVKKMLREGTIDPGGRVVLINTGSALKYPEVLARIVP